MTLFTGSHAYTVFGVLEDAGLKIPRLVKLRNPWGEERSGVWRGRWSPVWVQQQTKRGKMAGEVVRLLQCGRGEFFLPFETFLEVTKINVFLIFDTSRW